MIRSITNLYSDSESNNAESVDGAPLKNGICQTFDSYILKLRKWWQQLFVRIVKLNVSQW